MVTLACWLYTMVMDPTPKSVLILGRQPALGLAEAEALYGATHVQALGSRAALVRLNAADIAFWRMGGSTRLGQIIATVPTSNWQIALERTMPLLLQATAALPEGKIRLGISHIGPGASVRNLNTEGLKLKKAVKATGRSVRVVPNVAPELNTAQVLHNQLTGPTGVELLLIPSRGETVIARTVAVQDINAYAARDQKRPKRDARVGMLPPKLAQIIVNVALASSPSSNDTVVLDPFCGTGVVLQEASLMGYGVYGTDLEPRMIDYSATNLDWLRATHTAIAQPQLQQGDATNHHWQPLPAAVAGETYLGRPLSGLPSPEKLSEIMSDCDTIHRKFLANMARQIKPGTRLCLAVPAWKTPDGFKHLKTLASLPELGYNRIRFVHVDTTDLVYHRPDQLVARELVVLERM